MRAKLTASMLLARRELLGYRVGKHGHLHTHGGAWVWTDYPLLPDEAGKRAPIRRVRALGWDGNRYALIRWGGRIWELKAGYLYSKPGRFGEVPRAKLYARASRLSLEPLSSWNWFGGYGR